MTSHMRSGDLFGSFIQRTLYILYKTYRYVRSEGSIKIGKIGYGGTLDPLAQGLLAVGLGEGTKLLTFLLKGPKVTE